MGNRANSIKKSMQTSSKDANSILQTQYKQLILIEKEKYLRPLFHVEEENGPQEQDMLSKCLFCIPKPISQKREVKVNKNE